MKVIVSSPLLVRESVNCNVVNDLDLLKVLDGLCYNEDLLSNYIDEEPLADIGLEGGDIKLVFEAASKRLLVTSEYVSPRKLSKKEEKALVEYTSAQWSDGMGEDLFTADFHKHGWIENLMPESIKDVSVQQLEDGKTTKKRVSPLLKAAEKGELEKLKKLLLNGEELNSVNKWGQSVLYVAIANEHPDCAIFLIQQGAELNASKPKTSGPLHVAAMVGAVEVTEALLQKGADVNAVDEQPYTPAMWAANREHLNVLRLLVDFGAELNGPESDRSFHSYNGKKRSDIAEYLIERGIQKTEKESGLPRLLPGPINLQDGTSLSVGDGVEDRTSGARGIVVEFRTYWDRPGPYIYVDYGDELKREQVQSYLKKI